MCAFTRLMAGELGARVHPSYKFDDVIEALGVAGTAKSAKVTIDFAEASA